MILEAKGVGLLHWKYSRPFVLHRCSQNSPQIPFDSSQKAWVQIPKRSPKTFCLIAKLTIKFARYLDLFVVEHDVQKVQHHLAYAVLMKMVDLDQPVIMIMAIANRQGLVNPSLQILKLKL